MKRNSGLFHLGQVNSTPDDIKVDAQTRCNAYLYWQLSLSPVRTTHSVPGTPKNTTGTVYARDFAKYKSYAGKWNENKK